MAEVQIVVLRGGDPTSTGTQTNFVYVGSDGGLKAAVTGTVTATIAGAVSGSFTPHGLTTAGLVTTMAIDDTQWYQAPASPLANRNNISIQNQSTNGGVVLWNYSGSAVSSVGMKITPGGERSVAITQAIPVYVRMVSGTGTVVIEELS